MKMGLSRSCLVLIVIAGKERFAFKGVASNLVTYLTDVVKMNNSSAAKTVNSWCGFTSMLPLLLAPLADSYWDRYSTILAFSFVYVLGLVALTSTAFSWAWSTPDKISSSTFLVWSLCLISLGQGGYNPSLQAFGADQLDTDTDDEDLSATKHTQKPDKKSVFFKWWYFGVCTGSLLGVTVMSYIQDTFGWALGFAIPTVAMVTSTAFFTFASQIYTYRQDKNVKGAMPLINIVAAIRAATSKLKNRKLFLPIDRYDAVELELQEQKPLCDHHDVILRNNKDSGDDNGRSGSFVAENAKVVLRLLPIWTTLLMFAVIFQQPATFFTKQGVTMKRNIGSNFKIPPATLQSAITVSIILLMPLYDKILIPIIHIIIRCENGITVMQRMGIGMFISIIAMATAAIVETKRLEMNQQHSETVPLSIFWLLPQYILLGLSDIFTVVGMQEFFYNEVPVRMRTMAFAMYTSVFGVGSFMSALLISAIEAITSSRKGESWFSDDMRVARLDLYYWVLAVASAFSLLLYVIFCKFFKTRSDLDSEICK